MIQVIYINNNNTQGDLDMKHRNIARNGAEILGAEAEKVFGKGDTISENAIIDAKPVHLDNMLEGYEVLGVESARPITGTNRHRVYLYLKKGDDVKVVSFASAFEVNVGIVNNDINKILTADNICERVGMTEQKEPF